MLTVFLQFLFSGLTVGAVYALVGIGFNIIYNATSIINLAQGEFVVIGGLLMWFFTESLKLPFLLSAVLTILSAGLIGLFMERLTINPLKSTDLLLMIMITIAVSIVLRGILMFNFGKDPYVYPPFTEGEPLSIYGAIIQQQTLWVIGITGLCIILLFLFFKKTIVGKAMLACAVNPTAAKLVGINVSRMVMLSFILSAIVGAIGGMAITPISLMEYDKGPMLAVKGFCAAIMGGLGSNRGAVIGGFIIGILESMTAGYIHSGLKDAVALVILLLILFFKPAGIFVSKTMLQLRKF
ncbi:MAG: branched-chain amino acid ABC transporter permease [Nitrospirota bacterium]|nr:branched-chain amino acid ABC transporter permease [Nitrospirota bacterium]MDH5769056.1 branched-chain amino acid ABC transporter permease [Nitrospirota bacterium]